MLRATSRETLTEWAVGLLIVLATFGIMALISLTRGR